MNNNIKFKVIKMDYLTYKRVQKENLKNGWSADTSCFTTYEKSQMDRELSLPSHSRTQLGLLPRKADCPMCHGIEGNYLCNTCNGRGHYHF